MARGSGTVVISIIGKADKLKGALDESEKGLKSFGDKTSSALKGVASMVAGLGVGAALKGMTEAAIEDEAAQAKLAGTLRNNVLGATQAVVKSVEDQITKFQKVSTFTDDNLRPAFENLVRSTKDVGEANRLMAAAMDISAAKGLPLEQVSMALAKAHDGNVGALGRLGVNTKDAEGKTLSFEAVMERANKTFGGAASAALDTTAGKSAVFKRNLGELQETIGTALLPVVEKLATFLSAVLDWFSKLSPGVRTAILAFAGLVAGLVLLNSVLTTATAVAAAFGVTLELSLGPIALVVAAIALLAVGFYLAWTKCETFRDIVTAVAQAVTNAFMDMAGWVLDVIDKMLGGFATMAEAASHLPFVGAKFRGVADDIRGVQHTVQDMADSMHKGIDIVSTDLEKARQGFRDLGLAAANVGFGGGGGGIIVGAGPIRARASGGPVTGGRPYLVGEQGPELFMPGRNGAIVPNGAGGGGSIVINVSGALDPSSVARQIQDILLREKSRSGTLGLA